MKVIPGLVIALVMIATDSTAQIRRGGGGGEPRSRRQPISSTNANAKLTVLRKLSIAPWVVTTFALARVARSNSTPTRAG